jgi:Glycosyl transferases group 1
VVNAEGERYRLGLERLVRELGLMEHVHFVDRFFTETELAVLLASTDLYLTPYRSREQIVSGALTFAVAAGCPVVSTPYYYAEDLLGSGAGRLVPFDDPDAMSAAVLDLLDHPDRLERARAEARRVGSASGSPRHSGPRRSGPTTCSLLSTTWASSNTPMEWSPTEPADTASTTWPGWPWWRWVCLDSCVNRDMPGC